MRFAFCCVLACLILAMAAPASARLRVHDAELNGGRLVVTGSTTRRHQAVTLNGRFVRKSNRQRRTTSSLSSSNWLSPPGLD